MDNVFFEGSHYDFTWDKLGDIKEGRKDLGEDMPVLVYRMLEYSMNSVLAKEFGIETANEMFRRCGHLAGTEFANNVLDLDTDLDTFIGQLQETLQTLKVGILRIEEIKPETNEIIMTVAQDLDCSGLPPTGEVVCNYDEGFIAGILDTFTGETYTVREIDCWASGDRVCRFSCKSE